MTTVTSPNPFVIPGWEDTPNHPLCPWKRAPAAGATVNHTEYYCDVGGHEQAYSRFTAWASTPARLCDRGAVVVVGGPTGSGKTSLLHRCVHWIHRQLDAPATPVHVFDLTAAGSRGLSVDERARKVVSTVRIKLLGLQPPTWILEILRNGVDEIELVLELMAGMHNTDDVRHSFVVILPRQEDDTAWEEARKYCDWANEGVVFFMENATSQAPPEFEAHANASIFLSLRHLTEDEPVKFIQTWPGASSVSPSIPEAAVTRLHQYLHRINGHLTTRVLVATLREVFAERIDGTSEYQQLNYVPQQEAVDMMVKVLYQSGLGDAAR